MRIERRVAELLGDQALEVVGEEVLEYLRFGVHFVPRHAEALDEIQLEQAVVADHLERDQSSAVGELHPAIWLVLGEAKRLQLLHHPGHRRGADVEPLRQRVRRDAAPAVVGELVNGFCVVLNRGRKRRSGLVLKFRHA